MNKIIIILNFFLVEKKNQGHLVLFFCEIPFFLSFFFVQRFFIKFKNFFNLPFLVEGGKHKPKIKDKGEKGSSHSILSRFLFHFRWLEPE